MVIERNFLTKSRAVRRIDGEPVLEKDFENELFNILISQRKAEKPTFRQIISHNIRYKDESINNTIKTLNRYTSDVEYEALYLYLLGCVFDDGAKKQSILTKIKQEETYKERLEKKQTKNSYEIALSMIEDDILELNQRKASFNLNEDFERDLDTLNLVKYKINKISSVVSNLNIRKSLIEEAKQEMEKGITNIDLKQLESLYLEENIRNERRNISELLKQEKTLSKKIAKGDSFAQLEKIIEELNEKYRLKGEYENTISQLKDVEGNIEELNNELKAIEEFLFSDKFEDMLKMQIKKFNKHFASISNELYGEKYGLTYEKVINKKKQQVYKFSSFNLNMSSGKKQGEILCFDLAYIMFADEENIPCLHFLLNDKKELMHDNQLLKVANYVQDNNIQLVISILKDKLPEGLIDNAKVVVELSQDSKLFKIEQSSNNK